MAYIAVDLDGTLVRKELAEDGSPQEVPIDGAVDFINQLVSDGHRVVVYTARFSPMPETEKQHLKEQIDQSLTEYGFPPLEIWTGTTKPPVDFFIDDRAIPFDGDYALTLAHLNTNLMERGLA